jgi:hypothetical protein
MSRTNMTALCAAMLPASTAGYAGVRAGSCHGVCKA